MQRKVIKVGDSLGIIFPKAICGVLGIQLDSLLNLSIDEGAAILRPLGITLSARPEKLPTTRPHIELLRALDAWGMTKALFQRLSHDGMALGEFAGVVSLGQGADPVTLGRLEMCLSRRQTCRESWEATIDAVLAVRVPERECDADPAHASDIDGVAAVRSYEIS